MNKFESLVTSPNTNLSSNQINIIIRNAYPTPCAVPKIAKTILTYLSDNRNYISGDLAGKVLFWLFTLSYEPSEQPTIDLLADVIYRDFDAMSANRITRSCMALGYFQMLPDKLIDKIFNIGFIDRLENETGLSYCKV